MFPGDTFAATVVVRNTGNASWSDAGGFKFGQQESNDPLAFGPTRYLIDDSQNDIPEYGGIFRGRALTFQVEIIAPETEGTFMTHWGMLQEGAEWFGELIEKNIRVALNADIRQRSVQPAFNIYPNPASLGAEIHIDGEFQKDDRIALFSISGVKICEKEITNNTRNSSLNLKKYNLTEGVYFARIIRNRGIQTTKILVRNEF